MRFLFALLLSTFVALLAIGHAQTTSKGATVTIPACRIGMFGGTCPQQTLPVNLGGLQGTLTCKLSAGGTFTTSPDGKTVTITGLNCIAVKP